MLRDASNCGSGGTVVPEMAGKRLAQINLDRDSEAAVLEPIDSHNLPERRVNYRGRSVCTRE